jgi:hypothetical protein
MPLANAQQLLLPAHSYSFDAGQNPSAEIVLMTAKHNTKNQPMCSLIKNRNSKQMALNAVASVWANRIALSFSNSWGDFQTRLIVWLYKTISGARRIFRIAENNIITPTKTNIQGLRRTNDSQIRIAIV